MEDDFVADISIDIQILNNLNSGKIYKVKNYSVSVVEQNARITNSQDSFLFERNFYIEPGDYTINVTVTDLSNNRETIRVGTAFIPDPNDPVSNITNIQVFSKDATLDENYKPVTTYDLSNQADSIRFEFQVTNNKVDNPITINTRLMKFRSDTTPARAMSWPDYNASSISFKGVDYDKYEVVNTSTRMLSQQGTVTIEFLFPNLERGNYRFEIRTEGVEPELYKGRDFSIKSLNYPALKTPRELAAPLYYLMDEKEYKKMMAINDEAELKKAIDKFWLKNLKNTNIAQRVISLYYERVEEANKQFSNFKEGWKTDMGMMYILFGPPWYTFRSIDEVMWSYSYNRQDFETNFFFTRTKLNTKYFPFDNYLLARNHQYFNVQYQQIQKWLTGTILKDNL